MTQSIFEQGNVVGDLACNLFPDGKEIPFNPDNIEGMRILTQEYLDEKVKDIFEATFKSYLIPSIHFEPSFYRSIL